MRTAKYIEIKRTAAATNQNGTISLLRGAELDRVELAVQPIQIRISAGRLNSRRLESPRTRRVYLPRRYLLQRVLCAYLGYGREEEQ